MNQDPPPPLFILRGHNSEVSSVCFHPKSDILASSSVNGEVLIWNLKKYRSFLSFQPSLNSEFPGILAVKFDKNGNLLTQGRDGTVKLWDLNSKMTCPIWEIRTNSYTFCKCSLPPSFDTSNVILTPGENTEDFHLWDIKSSTIIKTCHSEGQGMNNSLAFCFSERLLVLSGTEDGSINLWNAFDGIILSQLKNFHKDPVLALSFLGQKGFSGSPGSSINPFSLDWSNNTLSALPPINLPNPGIADIDIRNDSKVIMSGGWDARVRLFSGKSHKPLAILNYHQGTVNSTVFNSYNQTGLIACGSKDNRISLYCIYPSKNIK